MRPYILGSEDRRKFSFVWTHSGLGSAATFAVDPDVLSHDLSLLVEGQEGRQLSHTKWLAESLWCGDAQRNTDCASFAVTPSAWALLNRR